MEINSYEFDRCHGLLSMCKVLSNGLINDQAGSELRRLLSLAFLPFKGRRILGHAVVGEHVSVVQHGDVEMTETKPITIFLGSTPDGAAVRIHQCQQQWDELQSSNRSDVRFCDHCQRDVHRVVDVNGFERAVAHGQCVMVAGFDPVEAGRQMFVGQAGALSYEVNAARPPWED